MALRRDLTRSAISGLLSWFFPTIVRQDEQLAQTRTSWIPWDIEGACRHCCVERSRAPGAASLPVRADGDRPNRANTTHLSRTGRPFDRLVRQSTGRSPATRRGRPL